MLWIGEACCPAREDIARLGTHLHRVMSIRLKLALVTRESVIEAAGAHGSCQVCLDATFEGVGAQCQTAPLEQSTEDNPCRSITPWGLGFPICPGVPPPQVCAARWVRPGQGRGYLMSQGGRFVCHPAHEALGMRPVPGTVLQLRVWVALLPIISRAWIVVLGARGRDIKAVSPMPCAAECT